MHCRMLSTFARIYIDFGHDMFQFQLSRLFFLLPKIRGHTKKILENFPSSPKKNYMKNFF